MSRAIALGNRLDAFKVTADEPASFSQVLFQRDDLAILKGYERDFMSLQMKQILLKAEAPWDAGICQGPVPCHSTAHYVGSPGPVSLSGFEGDPSVPLDSFAPWQGKAPFPLRFAPVYRGLGSPFASYLA